MDMEDRHNEIIRILRRKNFVKAAALSKELDVSVETIRKDLIDLQEKSHIVRVHGGAKLAKEFQESAYDRRRSVNVLAKEQIATAALKFITGGQTIFLDYGTTTYALARKLLDTDINLTVVTNALPIAQVLSAHRFIEIIVPGGILRKNENSFYGPLSEAAIASMYFELGFFGCAGVSETAGITNFHALEVATSRKAIEHSVSPIFLADSSKFGEIAPHKTVNLTEVSTIITDSAVAAEWTTTLHDADARLIIA